MSFFITSLKDISTYRSELMGWSILWIMMLHFTFNQIAPLGFVAQYGFAGVDIFLFVSGFGLFFSLDNNNDIGLFYKKRFLRIFPTYYIIGAITNILLTHDSFLTFLFRYSTIGFWIGKEYAEWFIPSIVILYLFAPLVKMLIDKKRFIIISIITVGSFLTAYFITNKEYLIDRAHFFIIYRIPAFIFGMICAYWIKNDKSLKYFIYVMLIGIPFFIYFYPSHHHIYNFKYFSLAFLLPLFVTIFILLSKHIKILSSLLREMGKASLEIYLIQTIIFSAKINKSLIIPPDWIDFSTVCFIILCSLLGIILHKLIDKSGIYQLL